MIVIENAYLYDAKDPIETGQEKVSDIKVPEHLICIPHNFYAVSPAILCPLCARNRRTIVYTQYSRITAESSDPPLNDFQEDLKPIRG